MNTLLALPLLAFTLLACSDDSDSTAPTDDSSVTDDSPAGDDSGADDSGADDSASGDSGADDSAEPDGAPKIIVFVGDGMGHGQRAAASLYAYGEEGRLAFQAMPVSAEVSTASFSGITDSAASATAMATGVKTFNGRIGMDPLGQELENLLELAKANGLATGVVTTASVTHATPAGFSAHTFGRGDYIGIADDQAALVPDVMLGGGLSWYLPSSDALSRRSDDGLIRPLEDAGCQVVYDRTELAAAAPEGCLFGLFAVEHLTYVRDLNEESPEPTLQEMTQAALDRLDADPEGFFLMVEGARIDMASHGNDLERAVLETLAFDEAVAATLAWAEARPGATILVTADHECGGLEIVTPHEAGTLPEVTWRWGDHTNTRITLHADGVGVDVLDGQRVDHTWVHALASARITGEPFVAPMEVNTPDGLLSDLRGPVSTQPWTSGFTEGRNQLDGLYVDADAFGLSIGLEGLFEWDNNAAIVLIDVDPGASQGWADLNGALSDTSGGVDALLSGLRLTAPGLSGFGVDFAAVSIGGREAYLDGGSDVSGVRGLVEDPTDLWWLQGTINFGDGVRTGAERGASVPGEGMELLIPWASLFPDGQGSVPVNAEIAITALIASQDAYLSNQLLPPLSDGEDNPGEAVTALPGVVLFQIDSDGDGVGDGGGSATVVAP